ncbi:MAG: DoxX family protein [Balneolaceae bacterium]|nr:DoxX family protein [Balneolaceae bacterium]
MLDDNTFYDIAILALRIVVALIFFSSGKSHFMQPEKRSKSIGLSKQATLFLGVAEMAGAISVALGIFPQFGVVLLIGVMLGAIYKKMFQWNVGFYSQDGVGWHYDLLLLCANLVFITNSGLFILIE